MKEQIKSALTRGITALLAQQCEEDVFEGQLSSSAPERRAAQNGIAFLLEHQRDNGSWPEQSIGIYWEIIGGYADPIYASVFPLLALNQFLRTVL